MGVVTLKVYLLLNFCLSFPSAPPPQPDFLDGVFFPLRGGSGPPSCISSQCRVERKREQYPELCTATVFPFDKARSGWLPPGSPSVCPNVTVSQPLSFAFWEPQPGCLAHLSLRFVSELLAFATVRAHGSGTVGINV